MGFALASRLITATKTTLIVQTFPAMQTKENLHSVTSRDVNAQSSWTDVKEVTQVHVDISTATGRSCTRSATMEIVSVS